MLITSVFIMVSTLKLVSATESCYFKIVVEGQTYNGTALIESGPEDKSHIEVERLQGGKNVEEFINKLNGYKENYSAISLIKREINCDEAAKAWKAIYITKVPSSSDPNNIFYYTTLEFCYFKITVKGLTYIGTAIIGADQEGRPYIKVERLKGSTNVEEFVNKLQVFKETFSAICIISSESKDSDCDETTTEWNPIHITKVPSTGRTNNIFYYATLEYCHFMITDEYIGTAIIGAGPEDQSYMEVETVQGAKSVEEFVNTLKSYTELYSAISIISPESKNSNCDESATEWTPIRIIKLPTSDGPNNVLYYTTLENFSADGTLLLIESSTRKQISLSTTLYREREDSVIPTEYFKHRLQGLYGEFIMSACDASDGTRLDVVQLYKLFNNYELSLNIGGSWWNVEILRKLPVSNFLYYAKIKYWIFRTTIQEVVYFGFVKKYNTSSSSGVAKKLLEIQVTSRRMPCLSKAEDLFSNKPQLNSSEKLSGKMKSSALAEGHGHFNLDTMNWFHIYLENFELKLDELKMVITYIEPDTVTVKIRFVLDVNRPLNDKFSIMDSGTIKKFTVSDEKATFDNKWTGKVMLIWPKDLKKPEIKQLTGEHSQYQVFLYSDQFKSQWLRFVATERFPGIFWGNLMCCEVTLRVTGKEFDIVVKGIIDELSRTVAIPFSHKWTNLNPKSDNLLTNYVKNWKKYVKNFKVSKFSFSRRLDGFLEDSWIKLKINEDIPPFCKEKNPTVISYIYEIILTNENNS